MLAIAYAAVRMDRINTHWDGYFSGFEDGKREGVFHAVGVDSDDDVRDLVERSEEMEHPLSEERRQAILRQNAALADS